MVGVFYGAMMSTEPELGDQIMNDLLMMTADGRLAPHVSARYSLDDAAVGLRAMMDRQTIGKIVIEP